MIKPLGKYVIVQLSPTEKQVGDIVLPDAHQKPNNNEGTVLSVGSGVSEVKPGMKVQLHGTVKLVKQEPDRIALCHEDVIVGYDDSYDAPKVSIAILDDAQPNS